MGTVIIGAGLAGLRCATTLRTMGYRYCITLIGDEGHIPYERPALSKGLLNGMRNANDLEITDSSALIRLGIEYLPSTIATKIDVNRQLIHTEADTAMAWSNLVFATGAHARELPETRDLANVVTLRTIADALRLRSELLNATELVIVGCGFVGAEVASAAIKLGVQVTVLEAAPVPFEPVLGAEVGQILLEYYRAEGIRVQTDARVSRVEDDGNGRAVAVRMVDGKRIPADLVLVGIGAVPNDSLFHTTFGGIEGRGIPVSPNGATSIPSIYACGDVALTSHAAGYKRRIEHWTWASEQARSVASHIAGKPPQPPGTPYVWSDQFDLRLQVVGHTAIAVETQILDANPGSLLVRYVDERGRLTAAMASNRPQDVAQWRKELIAV